MTSPKPEWWTSDQWATPPALIAELEQEFGAFDLDPCCRRETAKAPAWADKEINGLDKPWFGRVFLNPPYSDPGPWLEKACSEVESGRAALVVALIPCATETWWFHKFVWNRSELRFIRGRVRFHGWENTPVPSPRAPTMFAIYRKGFLS